MSGDFEKQFVDARNARGIALDEAASATKIRLEYLVCMENGDYDFGLPGIYVRGFVKIYAKYLKLDVDAVMANCPIRDFEVLNAKANKKISYNTIVTNEKEQDDGMASGVSDDVRFAVKFKGFCNNAKLFFSGKRHATLGIVCVGALLLLLILCKTFYGGKGLAEISPKLIDRELGAVKQSTISLLSTGNVKVVVREKASGEKIFAGNLESGGVRKINYAKPIQVFYDSGEFLLIEQENGERLCPQPGRGGMEIK
ncbi:MAG: helix-turn-helix domain-containing protein [Puniceicoccales bacterium]|jgi:hypothetical protein|nr:helix-turn-helix domain-containing protein [Puniceicoccales bacterium]